MVITQPGSVWGPHDPYLGESSRLAIAALKGRLRMTNDGFIAVVDVRDVAAAHTKLVEPGQGGRNFLLVGHNLMFRELISKLGDVTGRGLDAMRIPHGMAMGVGKMMDWIAGVTRARLPIGFEPPWILANSAPGDSSVAESTLGITWRPLEESLRDTVRWLHESGEISDRQAGTLAATAV